LIEDKLSGANLSDDGEVIPPFFKEPMDSVEKLQTHFFSQKNSAKTFKEHNLFHNAVLNTHR
ncbi:hypothetical protein AVEN_112984-1, partial [Araneus ventricosus]